MGIARNYIYKCDVCGNIIEVVHPGKPALVCCGQPMKRMEENTVDAAQEKHVPVVEERDGKVHVAVGSVAHPMADEHYIQWIELIAGDLVMRRHLNPGDAPEASFAVPDGVDYQVRAYCNLHGLWKAV